jgi:glutathione S-transferase
MQLIGLLDSPYVRRTAISLRCLGIAFEHRPISVFRNFDEVRAVNPVVKAPSFVCDDGTVLMDSNLILEYAESIAGGKSLMPSGAAEKRRAFRVLGLALAACEKSISIVSERQLRPEEKQHEPWIQRVTGQLLAACRGLEEEIGRHGLEASPGRIGQDGITSAVTWGFLQMMIPEIVAAAEYPQWRDFSARAERLAEFVAFPPV